MLFFFISKGSNLAVESSTVLELLATAYSFKAFLPFLQMMLSLRLPLMDCSRPFNVIADYMSELGTGDVFSNTVQLQLSPQGLGTIPSSLNRMKNNSMLFLPTGSGDLLSNVTTGSTVHTNLLEESSPSQSLPVPRNCTLAIGILVALCFDPPPILYLPASWPSFRRPLLPA